MVLWSVQWKMQSSTSQLTKHKEGRGMVAYEDDMWTTAHRFPIIMRTCNKGID